MEMNKLFDVIPERRNTDCVKWDVYPEDVLPLWIADTDFAAPVQITDAIKKRLEHPVIGYSKDKTGLVEAVVKRMKDRYDWNISEESVMLVPGIVTGFNFAVRAFCEPGQGVIFQSPMYPPFYDAPLNNHVKEVTNSVYLDENRLYRFDPEKFESAVTDDISLFMLCNPYNPVGRVYTPEELKQLGEICVRHNLTICSDEIHSEIIYSGHKHTPIASISSELSERTITFCSPSKTMNIPGLFCSFAIAENPELRERYKKAMAGLCTHVTILSQEAAYAAYTDPCCAAWIDQELRYLEANRDFMMDFISSEMPQIKTNVIEGTFLAWLDCSQAGISGSPSDFFLHEARVALNEGLDFGKDSGQFVRLNFGTSRALLTDALERMAVALKKS